MLPSVGGEWWRQGRRPSLPTHYACPVSTEAAMWRWVKPARSERSKNFCLHQRLSARWRELFRGMYSGHTIFLNKGINTSKRWWNFGKRLRRWRDAPWRRQACQPDSFNGLPRTMGEGEIGVLPLELHSAAPANRLSMYMFGVEVMFETTPPGKSSSGNRSQRRHG